MPTTIEWQPEFIDDQQAIFFNRICKKETINIKEIIQIVDIDDVDAFVDKLLKTNLVGKNSDSNLYLLTKLCRVAILPDGRNIVGEDVDGKFSKLIINYMDDRRSNK